MAFFDKVSATVGTASKAIGSKTKQVADSTKISVQITQEETNLKKAYETLGKAFYDNNGGSLPEEYAQYAAEIARITDLIGSLKKDKQVVTNKKYCVSCGAVMANEDVYCGKCGAKNPVAEAAAEAAAEFEAEAVEEPEAGAEEPAEEKPAEEPEKAETCECPSCKAVIKAGLLYCPECGAKLS